jgi:multidrug resistance efflux pump
MALSIVDADSFWVDGYLGETALPRIDAGDHARSGCLAMAKCCRDMSTASRAAS